MSSGKNHSSSVPTPVQVLSIIFYAIFGIAVSVTAIDYFWPAGIALAAFIAYQWGRIPTLSGGHKVTEAVDSVRPQTDAATQKSSGNSSFDAYRTELMARLEQEQKDFEAFLNRLRDARDKTQFDEFMADRANETA
jgi:hypothetical protein